jgi:benzodiazapine receptor
MAKLKEAGKLVLSVVICQLAGVFGSLFTMPAIPTWYASLNKPSFAPPGSVIGTVWLILYTLMGISLYLVWTAKKEKKLAISVFGFQLFLNALWSFLFFGLKSPLYGLTCIILMWISILATIILFYKIEKKAAYLLVPYLLWVSIATLLNYLILMLN